MAFVIADDKVEDFLKEKADKKYLEEVRKNEEEKERIRKIKNVENDIDECTIAHSVKLRRAWKRNGSK